jgi:hypothetical protein
MNDNQDFSGNQKRFADERVAEAAAVAETGGAFLKTLHKQMGETLINFPQTILPIGKIIMPPVPPAAPPPPTPEQPALSEPPVPPQCASQLSAPPEPPALSEPPAPPQLASQLPALLQLSAPQPPPVPQLSTPPVRFDTQIPQGGEEHV